MFSICKLLCICFEINQNIWRIQNSISFLKLMNIYIKRPWSEEKPYFTWLIICILASSSTLCVCVCVYLCGAGYLLLGRWRWLWWWSCNWWERPHTCTTHPRIDGEGREIEREGKTKGRGGLGMISSFTPSSSSSLQLSALDFLACDISYHIWRRLGGEEVDLEGISRNFKLENIRQEITQKLGSGLLLTHSSQPVLLIFRSWQFGVNFVLVLTQKSAVLSSR